MSVDNDPVAFSCMGINVFNRFESCRAHHIKAVVTRRHGGFMVSAPPDNRFLINILPRSLTTMCRGITLRCWDDRL